MNIAEKKSAPVNAADKIQNTRIYNGLNFSLYYRYVRMLSAKIVGLSYKPGNQDNHLQSVRLLHSNHLDCLSFSACETE